MVKERLMFEAIARISRRKKKGILRLTAVLFMSIILTACDYTQKTVQTAGARTEISAKAWDSVALENQKIIYGNDDRIDVYQETIPLRQQLANSTCALMSSSTVSDNGNGTWNISTSSYSVFGDPACGGEPFGSQPTAAFCTGFLVGDDLVATAGHCYDSGDIGSTRFVFGFDMENASTPTTVVGDNQVYTGIAVVGRAWSGGLDYAIVQIDRVVTSPSALPLEIRRTGTVALGTQVGVIGHPSGLPMKIAFGSQTTVRANGAPGYFESNLDTYGGNSGSPVFNASTGVVEGILVRGETDFVDTGPCFVSNQLLDSQGSEDVSKSTTFAQFIPELATSEGAITLNEAFYSCSDTLTVTVADSDLSGSASAVATTTGGDSEMMTLTETGAGTGRFTGTLTVNTSSVNTENGTLNVLEGQTITATYNDADGGLGQPAVVTDTAMVDCSGPPDYFTEDFTNGGAFDLDNTMLTFVPDGTNNFYSLCATLKGSFPTSPSGGTIISLGDDDAQLITPSGGAQVSLYGVSYSTFYVGSNGYITFSGEDDEFLGSTSAHFSIPRISALFDDLDPTSEGTISWRQLSNRVVITYEDVPQYEMGDSNNFQVELYFDGTIRVTYLSVAASDGIVGLSDNGGLPGDFAESDLSTHADCGPSDIVYVDFDWDGFEYGSTSHPWDTLGEALGVVEADGTIRLNGSSSVVESSEIFTGGSAVNQQVTLEASPAGSGVRVGVLTKGLLAFDKNTSFVVINEGEGAAKNIAGATGSFASFINLLGTAFGNTGEEVALREGTVFANALPYTRTVDGTRTAGPNTPLAIRMRSDADINAASIWGAPEGTTVSTLPGAGGSLRDVWIIVMPNEDRYFEGVIDLTLGARTFEGNAVQSDTESFAIALDIEAADIPEVPSIGVDVPHMIEPEEAYNTPKLVWLPIPAGVSPNELRLYYYHADGEARGWYPAENIEGWLVEDSFEIIADNGTNYFGFRVRHAGIVQLGTPSTAE